MKATLIFHDGSTLISNMTSKGSNEEIVVDEREGYSPSDLVQQKLQRLLPSASMPVSCLHTGRLVRRYTV